MKHTPLFQLKKRDEDLDPVELEIKRVCDGMFWGAESFNGVLSKWDVSRVTDMSCMFSSSLCFKRDLSKWVMSRVKDMDRMFNGAMWNACGRRD